MCSLLMFQLGDNINFCYQIFLHTEIVFRLFLGLIVMNTFQISFVINVEQCDGVLKTLISAGLGTIPQTSLR